MVRMTGGRAVVESLIRQGVDTIFGIPGVHTLEIYDALYENKDKIKHVVARHEGGAGFMADGYARTTGKIGVCTVITGPGVTNASTALGQAYSDSSPILMISSQNKTDHMDRDIGALHQLKDQMSVVSGCTAWSRRVHDPKEIPQAIYDAMDYLRTHRPRPVNIEIPTDVMNAEADIDFGEISSPEPFSPTSAQVDQAAQMLADAERPLIWAGGGAAGASESVTELAEMLNAGVVMTCAGKGVVREDHALNVGNKLRGDDEVVVKDFVASGDVILVVGSELGVIDTLGGEVELPAKMIRVDVDAPSGDMLYQPVLQIRSDARVFCDELIERFKQFPEEEQIGADEEYKEEIARVRQTLDEDAADGGGTRAIIDVLRQSLMEDDIVVCDMTVLCYRATSLYPALAPKSFLFPRGFGTLGWSLPAAIGAKLGNPDRHVVSICGDGGLMFTSQELATAVKYQLPLPILLMNNESYGVVKRNMIRNYDRDIGCDIENPDFVQMAEAFGAKGRRLTDAAQLPSAINEAFSANGPTVIEFQVDF